MGGVLPSGAHSLCHPLGCPRGGWRCARALSLRGAHRFTPQLEQLESRLVPALTPTAVEQHFLEQLNVARANPAAYGASIGLNLSGVAPSQPLAFDTLDRGGPSALARHEQPQLLRSYQPRATVW